MNRTPDVRIGTAGWSIPRAAAFRFESAGTHLQRYSRRSVAPRSTRRFTGRTPQRPTRSGATARLPDFRFAVKMPRTITHELKLQDAREPFVTFLAQTDGLAEKRGPILVQLPPSLSFDAAVVTRISGRRAKGVRRARWSASRGMRRGSRRQWPRCWSVTESHEWRPIRHRCRKRRVPAGWPRVAYFRLHGSPRKYWSRYDEDDIATLAATVAQCSDRRGSVVCVRQHRKRRRHRECLGTA